jgi:hypothetical protein
VVRVLQGKTEQNQSGNHEWSCDVHNPEAGLGIEMTAGVFHVDVRYLVVDPVSHYHSQDRGDDGGKVVVA